MDPTKSVEMTDAEDHAESALPETTAAEEPATASPIVLVASAVMTVVASNLVEDVHLDKLAVTDNALELPPVTVPTESVEWTHLEEAVDRAQQDKDAGEELASATMIAKKGTAVTLCKMREQISDSAQLEAVELAPLDLSVVPLDNVTCWFHVTFKSLLLTVPQDNQFPQLPLLQYSPLSCPTLQPSLSPPDNPLLGQHLALVLLISLLPQPPT